jgi:hypothetical protein
MSNASAREKVLAENNTAFKFADYLYFYDEAKPTWFHDHEVKYPTNIYFRERITENEWKIFAVEGDKWLGAFSINTLISFVYICLQIGWWYNWRELNTFNTYTFFMYKIIVVEFCWLASSTVALLVIYFTQAIYLDTLLKDFNTALFKPRGIVVRRKRLQYNYTYTDNRGDHFVNRNVGVIGGHLAYPANAASLAMVEGVDISADTNCTDLIEKFRAANEVFLNSYNRQSPPRTEN